jgi:hypothetical protein
MCESDAVVQLSLSIFCNTAPRHWVVWCLLLLDSVTVPSAGIFYP